MCPAYRRCLFVPFPFLALFPLSCRQREEGEREEGSPKGALKFRQLYPSPPPPLWWSVEEEGKGRRATECGPGRAERGGDEDTDFPPALPPLPFPRRLCHCKPPFPALQLSRKSGKLLLQLLGAISPSVHCRFQSPSVRQSWLFLGFMLAKTSYISYLFGSSFLYASQLSSCQKVFCKSSALTIATEKSAYTLSHLLNVFRSNNSMLLQFAK